MPWYDTYSDEGSFRGVGFFAQGSTLSVGRRTVRHDIPGRNAPVFEDIGLAAREFGVEALLVGPDYDLDRDRLLNALEQPGPGTLVHPWYGEIEVTVPDPARISETTANGGMCLISFRAVRYEAVEVEPVEADTQAELVVAADALDEAIVESFDEEFDVLSTIEDVRNSIVASISRATQAINAVRGDIESALSIVTDTAAQIDALADSAASLILAPVALVNGLKSVVASVVGAINTVQNAVGQVINLVGGGGVTTGTTASTAGLIATQATVTAAELSPVRGGRTAPAQKAALLMSVARDLAGTNRALEIAQGQGDPPPSAQVDGTFATGPYIFGDQEPEIPVTTPTRQLEADNRAAFIEAFRVTVTTEVVRQIAALEFDDADQAEAIRDELAAQLSYLASTTQFNDAAYAAYVDLRVALNRHFARVAVDLPALADYTPSASVPALVVAYELYGDPTRDREIILRNNVQHPGFVPGGAPLRVVTDG